MLDVPQDMLPDSLAVERLSLGSARPDSCIARGALTVDYDAPCVDATVTLCNLEALRPFHMRSLFRWIHLRQTFVATSHIVSLFVWWP